MGRAFAILQEYPYLAGSLQLCVLAVAALACSPRAHWRPGLLCGLMGAPWALLELAWVPRYWAPVRLTTLAGVGVEDVLFAAGTGVLGFACAILPLRSRLRYEFRRRELALAAVTALPVATVVHVCLYWAGAGVGCEVVIPIAAAAVVLLALAPHRWPLAAWGCAGFTLIYFGAVKLLYATLPHFRSQWNLPALSGVTLLGVPLEEVAWGAAFGAAWPLAVAAGLGLRLAREDEA